MEMPDKSKFNFSSHWVTAQFLQIRRNGLFRTDQEIWKKIDDNSAVKYIRPRTWGVRRMFPRRQWTMTIQLFIA